MARCQCQAAPTSHWTGCQSCGSVHQLRHHHYICLRMFCGRPPLAVIMMPAAKQPPGSDQLGRRAFLSVSHAGRVAASCHRLLRTGPNGIIRGRGRSAPLSPVPWGVGAGARRAVDVYLPRSFGAKGRSAPPLWIHLHGLHSKQWFPNGYEGGGSIWRRAPRACARKSACCNGRPRGWGQHRRRRASNMNPRNRAQMVA